MEKSLAMSLLQDFKKTYKRMFILLLVVLTMWFGTICLFVYYINTNMTEENTTTETIDIDEVDKIENSNISIGDK